jgi:regulator of ribonuclease activity A
MPYKTADICDEHPDRVRLVAPVFRAYGRPAFSGAIATVRVFEDNALVREAFSTEGHGRVLVVDGAGSMQAALIGDRLAQLAVDHGWAGAIVHGPVRDVADIATMPFGIRALGTCPFKSRKRTPGETNVTVFFGGVAFTPGEYVYVDEDGILVSADPLFGETLAIQKS